ncbi:hypothetical protein QCA50_004861 [Cerrena zonata]|uniref:Zn(2)-C6 fungal-type domain-containing protein n=1 Tax=Cerrena zonata TaxID=2478898 RepID=A0AAW0GFS1_9APHY
MSTQSKKTTITEGPTPLPRGAACLPCRKRKMRCDGGQPFCGQCVSKGRQEDCEYTTAPGLTRTQLLEENIALLETRIRELENPEEGTSIKLHDPRASSGLQLTQPGGVTVPGSASGSGQVIDLAQLMGLGEAPTTPAALTSQDKSHLIDAFVPHASQVGFFISIPRILAMTHGVLPPGSLLEAMLDAMYLWGSHFSNDSVLHSREAELLGRVVHSVSDSLFIDSTAQRGHAVLYGIQAEVLLANYYLANGRFLEGRYHISAAVSLAVSCKLNLSHTNFTTNPLDPIEEGERVDAFWQVYVLDKAWAVALKSPSSISEDGLWGTQIDTPWPLTLQEYEQGVFADLFSNNTVQMFLAGLDVTPPVGYSPLALRAQATILFSRASIIANQYKHDMSAFQHECVVLDDFVSKFLNTLPVNPESRDDLVTAALGHVALIQLHMTLSTSERKSRDACVAAARATLATLQTIHSSQMGFINPIVATLLTSAGQVFVEEIATVKASNPSSSADAYLNELATSVERILAIMADFAMVLPIMGLQAAQLQSAYQHIN